MIRLGYEVRADERRLVTAAALVAMALGGGQALVASAADALFLARVGVRQLGTVFALSSAALILVLGYVGAVADRRDRGRLLVGLALTAAATLCALAIGLGLAPRLVATATLVLGKQLAAALDLAFWVVIAERFDARQGRRLVPLLVAALGLGTALGAFAVAPLAHWVGARGVLGCGAVAYAVAAVAGLAIGSAEVRPLAAAAVERPRLTWSAGWRAVRGSPLARRLGAVVAVAGIFAPILYYLLGAAAARSYGDEAAIAGFLGQYRGVVQILTLSAAFLAPALLARTGVAPALLVAPVVAVAAAVALAISYELAVVAVAQASARIFDNAVQTPAEKLVQNLLPRQVRGRVHGFLDGVAKRAGAIAGGLAASALVVWWSGLAAVTVAVALAWLALAWRLRSDFADLAVAELASRRRRHDQDEPDAVAPLVDERSIQRLRADLGSDGDRRGLAIELVSQLGQRGKLVAARELAEAARRTGGVARLELLAALDRLPGEVAPADDRAVVAALLSIVDDGEAPAAERAAAVRALGRRVAAGRDEAAAIEPLTESADGALALAARLALARMAGGDRVDPIIDQELEAGGERRRLALAELRAEVDWLAGAAVAADGERSGSAHLVARAQLLLGGTRGDPEPEQLDAITAAIARCRRDGMISAPLVLLRAGARELAGRLVEARSSAQLQASALGLLAALGDPDNAGILARALGDPDEEVRRQAEVGLRALGGEALEVLLVAASFGRRVARNSALELLRDLRITSDALDHLIESELGEIDATTARIAALATLEAGPLLVRRLEERIAEAANTLFLAVEARLGEPAIGAAARQFLRARDPRARARALETLDTVLPRPLAARLLPPLDAGPLDQRSARAAARLGIEPVDREQATRAELSGVDPLARMLVVAALGSSGRASHREAIAAAAAEAAMTFDPISLIRRISGQPAAATREDPEEDEMPRSVETMMVLSQLPIFSELTTRQLADLADVVGWQSVSEGATLVREGEAGEAMYFVLAGRVEVTRGDGEERRSLVELGPGELFGEMALFEDAPRSATVTARERTQLGRISRHDFEELVEDVPGIALAICRVLSRRVRQANLG